MINKFKLLYTLMLVLCSDENIDNSHKNIKTSPIKISEEKIDNSHKNIKTSPIKISEEKIDNFDKNIKISPLKISEEKIDNFDKNIKTSPLKSNYNNQINTYNVTPPLDKRIKVLQYRKNTIYDLSLVAKFKTKIIFEKGEEVQNLAFGESQGVDVIYNNKEEEIILQPLYVGIDTNLIITTNLREYIFSLKSYENSLANEDKLIYILSFQYPMSEKVEGAL